jgi:hypothetical protein
VAGDANAPDRKRAPPLAGFLWSASTMMVTSLLPVFMRQELGASNLSIGLLEGVATLLNTAAKVRPSLGLNT